jgi:hypothetical protein
MKKFKQLFKQLMEDATEGGSVFTGFSDMQPRTAHSDFGVHRIGEGDSVSRLNAFIHKFLGGTYIDPNGAIKELKSRLNMVGLDFDFDGSKIKLNPGENVFPVKLYGDVFGQTPTTDLSVGFDRGDDLPMLKLMVNCSYDEETCMWSLRGKLGLLKKNIDENYANIGKGIAKLFGFGAKAAPAIRGGASVGQATARGAAPAAGQAAARGAAPAAGQAAARGGAAAGQAAGAVARSSVKPAAAAGQAGVRASGRASNVSSMIAATPEQMSANPVLHSVSGNAVPGMYSMPNITGRSISYGLPKVSGSKINLSYKPSAFGGNPSLLPAGIGSGRTRISLPKVKSGQYGTPSAAYRAGKFVGSRLAGIKGLGIKSGLGKLASNRVTRFGKRAINHPVSGSMIGMYAYDKIFGGGGGEGGAGGGGGSAYAAGAAANMADQLASATTVGGFSTIGMGMMREAWKKKKMGEYGTKKSNKMCEYGCDSEEGEEGPLSSPGAPSEQVVGYLDQMGGPISESTEKGDKARSVMHQITRKGAIRDKVLLPVYNNLIAKKLRGKLNTDDIQKQLFYVVNSTIRKMKVALSDKEKSRVVNDLIRNFRSYSKKKSKKVVKPNSKPIGKSKMKK